MGEVLGPLNVLNKALPTGIDGVRLAEWTLRDGVTYEELVNIIALALGDINQQIVADWGWLFFLTEELFQEYEQGGSVTPMPELTDTDRPEAGHGETIGHMIELHAYGDAVGGSRRYFRDIRSPQLGAAVSRIVRRGIWRFEQTLLNRWFSNAETTIGSAGYNVPFVRGTGGNVDFAPPAWEGEAFTTSHDHYLGIDTDTKGYADGLNELAETLQEHGHDGPWDALVARADIASYSVLTDFAEIIDIQGLLSIDRAGATTGNQFFQRGERTKGHFGDYQTDFGLVRLHMSARIPTKYLGAVKSYGSLDSRNPIAIRIHPMEGFGMFLVPETVPNDDVPIKQLDVEFEFGVGVGMDRTNGAAAFLDASGNYSVPTIS